MKRPSTFALNVKKVQRIWNATLDSRTRATHARLDNKPEDRKGFWHIGDDKAMNPGGFGKVGNNINCRCRFFESINGSRPEIRRGRNPETGENEIFEYKDFDKWAEDNNMTRNKSGKLVQKSKKSPKKSPMKRPSTFALNVKKVQNTRLPKNIAIKGIDSEEYKQWIWENWT